jgi:sugar lactone lactonase YvrE
MIKNNKVQVVSKDLGGPNGLAFSPDEKYFYVTNWDIRDIHHTKTLWRYEVQPDGTLKNGKVFFDWNLTEDDEAYTIFDPQKKVFTVYITGKINEDFPNGRFIQLWALPETFKIINGDRQNQVYEFKARMEATEPRKNKGLRIPQIELYCKLKYSI